MNPRQALAETISKTFRFFVPNRFFRALPGICARDLTA